MIAPSFGAIFQNNCYRSGVLPVVLPRETMQPLTKQAAGGTLQRCVDRQHNRLAGADGGEAISFTVPACEHGMLLEGLGAIGVRLGTWGPALCGFV